MTTHNVGYDAGGAAQAYTTLAGALADAGVVNGDTLNLLYSNASQSRLWTENNVSVTKAVTIQGGLGKRKVTFGANSGNSILVFGDIGNGNTALVSNLTIAPVGSNSSQCGVYINCGSGRTVNVTECMFVRLGSCGVFAVDGTTTVTNSMAVACGFGFRGGWSGLTNFYNCTAHGCGVGFDSGDYSRLPLAVNCVSVENATSDFRDTWHASSDYNCSSGTTAPGANSRKSQVASALGFLRDGANSAEPFDYRLSASGTLLTAGTSAGLTRDIDGQTIDQTVSAAMGCSSGVSLAGTSSNPGTANVYPGVGYYVDGTSYTGAMDVPSTNAVLSSDSVHGTTGNWTAATSSKYQVGETYGEGGTSEVGSYNPASGAPDAATISGSDHADGTLYCAITGAGTADSVTVYYSPVINGTTWTDAGSVTGAGTRNFALSDGAYWLTAASGGAGGTTWGSVQRVRCTDGSDAIAQQVVEAVAAAIDSMALKDSGGTSVAVLTAHRPTRLNEDACRVAVFLSTNEPDARQSAVTERVHTVGIQLQQRCTSDAQRDHNLRNVERIEDELYARRALVGLNAWIDQIESGDAEGYDPQAATLMFIPMRVSVRSRKLRA